jgi:hypothetical protein
LERRPLVTIEVRTCRFQRRALTSRPAPKPSRPGSPITDAKSKAELDWFDTVKEWMWICTSRDRS